MKLRSVVYQAVIPFASLFMCHSGYALSSGINQLTPTMQDDSQIYGTYQYIFTVTVTSPLDAVVGTTGGNTFGTYYAACPPGSEDYYPPGYSGPRNLTVSDAQVNAANCGRWGQCDSHLNMHQDGYYHISSTASCSAKTSGWMASSVVKAASRNGLTGYFGLPVLTGYHYQIVATSLWRQVIPSQSVVIPGFDMNPDLNSVYVVSVSKPYP